MNATIQAQADYKSRFGNFRYRVQIVDSDQEAENIREYSITPQGAVIEYEAQDENIFQPIVPSTCRFTFICKTTADVSFMRKVARAEAGRYGVRVLRADNNAVPTAVFWVGTLISDQFTFSDTLPLQVDVIATDDLGYLNEVPYKDLNGDLFTGFATTTEHILNCIKLLRTSWHWQYTVDVLGTPFFPSALQYSQDFISNNFLNSGNSSDNIFDQTKIRHLAFRKDDEEQVATAYEVLKELMLFYNCQIYSTYSTSFFSFVVQPVGSLQKFAEDGSAVQLGKYKRTNNVTFTTYQQNISLIDIGSTSSNDRLSGGVFNYLQPYKKVIRTNNREDLNNPIIFAKSFEETQVGILPNGITMSDGNENAQIYKLGQTYTLPTISGFEAGEQFRLRVNLNAYFNSSSNADVPSLIHSTATGFSGTMPEAFNIFRIKVTVQVRFSNTGGNDHYLKRELTSGGQVPIYADFEGFTSTPQYYTDDYAIEDATFDTSGVLKEVEVISEPFDGRVSQNVFISEDIITPALTNFGTDPNVHESTKFNVKVELIAHENSVLTVASSGNNFLFEDAFGHNIQASLRLVSFQGYESVNLETFTSINDIDARKTLEAESPQDIGDFATMFASPIYLHSSGQYLPEATGYRSRNESNDIFPAAKLSSQEIAAYYSRHREIYDGNVIKVVPTLATVFSYDNDLVGGNTETIKSKVHRLRYVTGIEEASVTLFELARDKHITSVDSNIRRDNDGGFVPPPEPPTPPTTGLTSALLSNMGVVVAPSVDVTAAAVARNRSSQTGSQLAALDENGVIQEITDGSNGQFLTTNGSGVYSFDSQNFVYVLASGSMLLTMGREDFFYYGSNIYGWGSNTWNSSSSSSSSISDEYAHNGILIPYGPITRLSFKATVRNDSNANDIDLTICKANRPNGSTSDITLTSIGTATASNSSGVDLHYNCDVDITGLNLSAGGMIFLLFRRQNGGNVSTNVNVSFTLLATI